MRSAQKAAALALLALLALFGAACGREEGRYFGNVDRGERDVHTLYINGSSEPEHLDPAKSADVISTRYIHQMFEGLMTYGPRDLRPVQGVARAFEQSEDGLRYRFHLRPEARWSDGRPVVSRDFEYAWKRALRPETASRAAPELYPLKNAEAFHKGLGGVDEARVGVHATDEHTLEVELERPTPHFLDLLCRPAYAPVRRDVVESFARRGEEERWVRPENIVVNGPYTLEAWRFRYEITMKVNPHYWAKDTLRIRRIVWLEADGSRTAMNLYRSGELDALGGWTSIPAAYIPLVEPTLDLRRYPLLLSIWLDLNTRAPPLDDVRVRRALDLALDKQAIVSRVLHGMGAAASHYVPESTGGGYAEHLAAERAKGMDPFSAPAHDPARARGLLAEAGYEIASEGGVLRAREFPPIELVYPGGNEVGRDLAVAMQDMWRRHLGVHVTTRGQEYKVMIKEVRDGHFQVASGGWVADYNHPHTFLEPFTSGSPTNYPAFHDPAFDDLEDRASRALDPREGARLYRQAEARALAGMSRIPLFFGVGHTLVKPWVKGYFGNGRSMELVRWMWIDPLFRAGAPDEPAAAPFALPTPGRLEP